MTPSLKDRIHRVMALDKVRTSGAWKFVKRSGGYEGALAVLIGEKREVCNFGDDTQFYPTAGMEPDSDDMDFIAAAPEMVAIIRELVAAGGATVMRTPEPIQWDYRDDAINLLQEQVNQRDALLKLCKEALKNVNKTISDQYLDTITDCGRIARDALKQLEEAGV